MLAKYNVTVTDVVANPEQDGAPESVFVVPNNSAFHLLIKNQGPAEMTIHQDGAFITPLPKGESVLRTFRTPGRLSVRSAAKAVAEITVLAVNAG
jgi:hypothetical protein